MWASASGRSGALFVFEGFTTEDTESTEETNGEKIEPA
jgi:hypothetical protein